MTEPAVLPEGNNDVPDKDVKGTGEKLCPVCGEPIFRVPGARGRLKKYHDECRPTSSVTTRAATGRLNKAEQDADKCIAMIKPPLMKGAVILMAIEPYDAFAVMAQLPGFLGQLRGVLVRHQRWRDEILAMKSGGSIVGMIVCVLLMVLPILAHHKLIPLRVVSEMLEGLPKAMFRLQQQMKQGEEKLTEMMNDKLTEAEEALKRREAAKSGPQQESHVDPS